MSFILWTSYRWRARTTRLALPCIGDAGHMHIRPVSACPHGAHDPHDLAAVPSGVLAIAPGGQH